MKIKRVVCLIAVTTLFFGCYQGITGKVIDAETGQAIEGVVVMVEWTGTKGFGLTHTVSYKVAERKTDRDGIFTLPGCFNPLVEEPNVTIYKKGYVAWSSRWVFPDRQTRTDYKWSSNQVYKLVHFKKDNSYADHTNFIRASINSSMNLESKRMIYDAFRWEDREASIEQDRAQQSKTHIRR